MTNRRAFLGAAFALAVAPAVVLAGPRRPRFHPYLRKPRNRQGRSWEYERRGNRYYRRPIYRSGRPGPIWYRCPWGLEQSLLQQGYGRQSYLSPNYKSPAQSWWESYLKKRFK